jgi:hypothetical protein
VLAGADVEQDVVGGAVAVTPLEGVEDRLAARVLGDRDRVADVRRDGATRGAPKCSYELRCPWKISTNGS